MRPNPYIGDTRDTAPRSQIELEQQTLSQIARMLNSTLELNTVLKKVVEAATFLTGAEQGLLLMPDDEGRALYIRAAKGLEDENAEEFRVKTEDTLAGRVFKTGEPALVSDAGFQKLKTEYLVRSLLYVAMSVKGQIIGVLGVNNRESDRSFSAHDRELLEDLASHAAIAIENARLYGESITRSHELTMLVKASQAVNASLSLQSILPVICEQLNELLRVGCSEIMILDQEHGHLSLLASYRQIEWADTYAPQPPTPQRGVFLKSVENRQPLSTSVSSYLRENGGVRQSLVDHSSGKSYVMPLYAAQRPLGVIEFTYSSNVIVPVNLLSSLTFQQYGLELVLSLGPLGTDQARTNKVAGRLLQESNAGICTLWFWDHRIKNFQARVNIGHSIWLQKPHPIINVNNFPLLQQVLEQGKPLVVPDNTPLAAEADSLLNYYTAQTLLVLPLLLAGRVIGLVVLADTLHKRRFRAREIDLAQALITQAANALQNAWLYRDLQVSIEELRHTQSKLVQSARLSAIGELSAAVAHQINNPLTTVLADTEMLLEDISLDGQYAESLEAIHRAGKRAYEVVRRLLSMAHQADSDAETEPMDVNTTIQNTLALVVGHIQRGRAQLVTDFQDELPLVYGLRGQLEDVWLNLLLNARDALRDTAEPVIGIRSGLSNDGTGVVVKVWDNGPGIPAEKQQAIFEAFYTTKAPGEGTGLGLYICQQVVSKCGGTISVQNLTNGGACFTVYLPAAKL